MEEDTEEYGKRHRGVWSRTQRSMEEDTEEYGGGHKSNYDETSIELMKLMAVASIKNATTSR